MNSENFMSKDGYLPVWRVHTPNLLKEITKNSQCAILQKPLMIFASLLHEVGERAAELNDPQLDKLMCQLTIYSCADPESEDYNKSVVETVYQEAAEAKRKYGEATH